MKMSLVPKGLLLVSSICLAAAAAQAQTSVALSVYGAFNGAASNGASVSPSNAAGGMIELRHIKNSLAGFEATYSFNRANQADSYSVIPPCPVQPGLCGPMTTTAPVPANAHEVTGDWVASWKIGSFRPFALAGGGVLFDVPTAGTVNATVTICDTVNPLCVTSTASENTSTQIKGVFVYGAGMDWGLLPHLGLRLQYRGNVYKAPALLSAVTSIDAFTHTAEPMIGVYFRF